MHNEKCCECNKSSTGKIKFIIVQNYINNFATLFTVFDIKL